MRMREDENVAKYVERIKASVSAIRASRGEIKEETIISKILKTFLWTIYAIRVSTVQEKRCDPHKKIGLNELVWRLTTFELDNFDNNVPTSKSIESAFEARLSLKEKGKGKKEKNQKARKKLKKV